MDDEQTPESHLGKQEGYRVVHVGTLPDGRQMMVERFFDQRGNETSVWAAFRERADTTLTWGPPTKLEKR